MPFSFRASTLTGRIAAFAALWLIAAGIAVAATPKPIPILLDTDIGSDIDDACALALVIRSPQLDLKAVTTVSGDTHARARLAAKMLWIAGRRSVPVAAGVPGGKLNIDQAPWAAGFRSPELLSEPAVQLMKTEIDREHGRLVIVAIGPLTNIAALLRQYPAEARKIRRIVLMGGSIAQGYYPNSPATAEYNIAADPQASQVVFSSGIPVLEAPLDVTHALQLENPYLDRIFAQPTPLAHALQALYKLWGARAHTARSHGRLAASRSLALHPPPARHPHHRLRHDRPRSRRPSQCSGRSQDRSVPLHPLLRPRRRSVAVSSVSSLLAHRT